MTRFRSRLIVYALIFATYWAFVFITFKWDVFPVDIFTFFQVLLCGLHVAFSFLFRFGKWWAKVLFALVMAEAVFWGTLKWNPVFYASDGYGIVSGMITLSVLPLLAWEVFYHVWRFLPFWRKSADA